MFDFQWALVGVVAPAVALGATVVETHFTLARADGEVNSGFSLEPAVLGSLVSETERALQSLGQVRYVLTEAEQRSLVFRPSIYAAAAIATGELFTKTNIRIVRPGHRVRLLSIDICWEAKLISLSTAES